MKDAPPTDEELLALLRDVEAREALLGRAVSNLEEETDEPDLLPLDGDPCPHCAEPALMLDACNTCAEDGCLPRDDWLPGHADPCLTRCARCGLHVHVDCAFVNEAGNPVCCGPRWTSPDDVPF